MVTFAMANYADETGACDILVATFRQLLGLGALVSRSTALREVPVDDLLPSPEKDAGMLLDMYERST